MKWERVAYTSAQCRFAERVARRRRVAADETFNRKLRVAKTGARFAARRVPEPISLDSPTGGGGGKGATQKPEIFTAWNELNASQKRKANANLNGSKAVRRRTGVR